MASRFDRLAAEEPTVLEHFFDCLVKGGRDCRFCGFGWRGGAEWMCRGGSVSAEPRAIAAWFAEEDGGAVRKREVES